MRVEAHDHKRLEQLCRYITRPALPDERVQINAAGQVELKLRTPRRDGTTHLVMSPLEFMQRLAALIPQSALWWQVRHCECRFRVGQRQQGERSHRRKADLQVERP